MTGMIEEILDNTINICFRRTRHDVQLVYTTHDNEYTIYADSTLIHAKKPLNTHSWCTATRARYDKLIALAEDYWGMSISDITYGTMEYKLELESPGVSTWLP